MEVRYNLPTLKYCTIEIPINAGTVGGQLNFPINNYLIGRKIYGLEVFLSTDILRSPISSNNLTWTLAQAQVASLTLHCFDPTIPDDDPRKNAGKGDWIKDKPVLSYHRMWNTNAGQNGVSVFDKETYAGLEPDWNNSYIKFLEQVVFAANTSAVWGVYYK